jgi:hypothetical protein
MDWKEPKRSEQEERYKKKKQSKRVFPIEEDMQIKIASFNLRLGLPNKKF